MWLIFMTFFLSGFKMKVKLIVKRNENNGVLRLKSIQSTIAQISGNPWHCHITLYLDLECSGVNYPHYGGGVWRKDHSGV